MIKRNSLLFSALFYSIFSYGQVDNSSLAVTLSDTTVFVRTEMISTPIATRDALLQHNRVFGSSRPNLLAIKTNLLYTGVTLTPNIALEVGLGRRTSIALAGSYNPWNLKGKPGDNKKMVHYLVKPEFRYWFCERFNGHFIGTHLLYSHYNIGGYNLPYLFGSESDKFRHEGMAFGGGFNYGYHRALTSFFAVEATVGLGYLYNKYDQYDAPRCGGINIKGVTKSYLIPSTLAINLVLTL